LVSSPLFLPERVPWCVTAKRLSNPASGRVFFARFTH
jgi:hypothetical protein